jgi:hypothetical protein
MKKSLIALTSAGLFMAVILSGAHAQGSNNVIAFTDTKSFMSSVRSIYPMLNPADMSSATATDAADVNAKALKDFKIRFGNAMDAKWFEVPNGFISYFRNSESESRVIYNKKGRWQYTLKSYQEDKLPKEIRALVKSTYYDYKITIVEEITVPDGMNYIVHLEDETTIKNLRVTQEGDMDILTDFTKSK